MRQIFELKHWSEEKDREKALRKRKERKISLIALPVVRTSGARIVATCAEKCSKGRWAISCVSGANTFPQIVLQSSWRNAPWRSCNLSTCQGYYPRSITSTELHLRAVKFGYAGHKVFYAWGDHKLSQWGTKITKQEPEETAGKCMWTLLNFQIPVQSCLGRFCPTWNRPLFKG